MRNDCIIFYGILLILYSGGNISATQLFILLALVSTLSPCLNVCANNGNQN